MDFSNIYEKKTAYAKYMVKEITHICKKFEKREPGTKGEEQACEYMSGVLKKLGCESQVESFQEHPRSFFGWIFITITCVLLAIILLFVGKATTLIALPIIGACLIVFGLVIVFLQFGLYKKP